MAPVNPSVRALARRLLNLEAAPEISPETSFPEAAANQAMRVVYKLRASLTRFAGPDGFAALLRRALKLTRAEFSALGTVTIKLDGSLEGLDALSANGLNGAAEAIITHLLNLLITFIGEPLTLQLVRDAWPQIIQRSLDEFSEASLESSQPLEDE